MTTKYSEAFERFWKSYPRKIAKPKAWQAWQKHVDETDAFMVTAIVANIEKRTRLRWWPRDAEKIPHPATWINQQRYLDEGWEDEIKKRTDGPPNSGPVQRRELPVDRGPEMDRWQTLLQRILFACIQLSGGFTDEQLKRLVAMKNATYRDMKAGADEEVAAAPTEILKKRAALEMAHAMADRFMHDVDRFLGTHYRGRVLAVAAKNKRQAVRA